MANSGDMNQNPAAEDPNTNPADPAENPNTNPADPSEDPIEAEEENEDESEDESEDDSEDESEDDSEEDSEDESEEDSEEDFGEESGEDSGEKTAEDFEKEHGLFQEKAKESNTIYTPDVNDRAPRVNALVYNNAAKPAVNFNFMLRVEAVFDLPCKSVRAFTKENEYEYIQEGGLNDYVHIRRKPISQPFKFEVERYVASDWIDPLTNGAELILPVFLFVTNSQMYKNFTPVRTFVFTGCTVISKTYGELNADQSGLLTETVTIAYRELITLTTPGNFITRGSYKEDSTNPIKTTYARMPHSADTQKSVRAEADKHPNLWKYDKDKTIQIPSRAKLVDSRASSAEWLKALKANNYANPNAAKWTEEGDTSRRMTRGGAGTAGKAPEPVKWEFTTKTDEDGNPIMGPQTNLRGRAPKVDTTLHPGQKEKPAQVIWKSNGKTGKQKSLRGRIPEVREGQQERPEVVLWKYNPSAVSKILCAKAPKEQPGQQAPERALWVSQPDAKPQNTLRAKQNLAQPVQTEQGTTLWVHKPGTKPQNTLRAMTAERLKGATRASALGTR
jgi:hypothetical protein